MERKPPSPVIVASARIEATLDQEFETELCHRGMSRSDAVREALEEWVSRQRTNRLSSTAPTSHATNLENILTEGK